MDPNQVSAFQELSEKTLMIRDETWPAQPEACAFTLCHQVFQEVGCILAVSELSHQTTALPLIPHPCTILNKNSQNQSPVESIYLVLVQRFSLAIIV